MANPTFETALDDLYGRYRGLTQQIDDLALQESYGAVTRRGELDYERKQLYQQFEQAKARQPGEYQAWKNRIQTPVAPAQEPASPSLAERSGLSGVLRKGWALAYRGAQGFADLPLAGAQALGRGLGLPKAAENIGPLRKDIERTATGFEEAAG